MNKLVPDPPVTDLLLLDPPALSLIDNPPGDMRNAMGMNIRLLCRLINAVCDHTHATHRDHGAAR